MNKNLPSGKGKITREEIEKWFEEHGDGLYRFSLLRVNDSDQAEDLVQETFLAALQSWDSYEGKSQIRGWLLGILKHKIADHFRKEGRFKEVKNDFESDLNIKKQFGSFCWKNGFGPNVWNSPHEDNHLKGQFMRVVNQCIEKLTRLQKEVFVLREIEEYKTKEIEQVSGMKSNHIRVTLYRARVIMRSCIEKLWVNNLT